MNKRILKKGLMAVAAATLAFSVNAAEEEKAKSLEELLQMIDQGTLSESKEHREREQRFLREQQNRQRLLNDVKAQLNAAKRKSEALEKTEADNERAIGELQEQYNKRLGSLKELFGHLSGTSGDVISYLGDSIVSAQYPGRTEAIDSLRSKISGATPTLPEISEIEGMWKAILFEINQSTKIVKYNTAIFRGGEKVDAEVMRVGNYALVSGDEYLNYDKVTGNISSLPRQPQGSYTSSVAALGNATSGFTAAALDPQGAQGPTLMTKLVDLPTLTEKWHEGRLVGYVISGVGVFAVLLALLRFVVLSGIGAKVNAQLRDTSTANTNNPLGRVLKVAEENPNADAESLELKLHEAVLKERPAIESGLNLLKIIAMVAPLLGLLGTVTGMILTFQAITIFGAGDPKNMAGGISSALVTTVLGLVVAIPTILLHTLVNGRAQRVLHILEEQSAGIVAENAEGH
ncbi:MotA/TolQ/ExbB proton channel family protein [Porticoccus sp. W117]|uniref:MotA/TolQ/ExbB proton channel family protein n=1 Tax=Porticoccus sp. W117 TaxID=3054777 RepID=UPI00259865A1|nr:MotA/TolQ/ExbB proton channel family protein [Porticoccus sp. W117]MDM3872303.1 MotA/TolQ/ExbB proton channel family protein [Porticoccus sp. W117]